MRLALGVALLVAAVAAVSTSAAPPAHGTRLVVFVAPKPGGTAGGLELTDRRGRVLRVLSTARFGTIGRWSPDDRSIAWLDPSGISVAESDGSNARLLVPANTACRTCQQLSFIWSPDSRSLVVGSAGKRGNELQRVPVDGSAPTVLAGSTDAKHFYSPAWWTPDGKSLVYTESRSVAITGAWTRMLTPATGKTVTLWSTATAQGAKAPLISPNLRYWAYIDEIDPYHQRLRIVDKNTGRVRVAAGVNSTNLVGWSPDSRTLNVVESGWHVVTVSTAGAVLRRLGPGQTFFVGRHGDLFVLRRNDAEVWASANGGPERFLFRLPQNETVVSLDAN
jgi:Tol biopolymer transport system component